MHLVESSVISLLVFLNLQPILGASCSSNIVRLEATDTVQELTSPGYPGNYPNNELCRWVLTARENFQVVTLNIIETNIPSTAICTNDYLLLQDGEGIYAPSIRTCCGNSCTDSGDITTSKQSVRITFFSDSSLSDSGFKLEYWAVPKFSKEYSKPTMGPVNYILFVLFGLLIISFFLTILFIGVKRRKIKPDPSTSCDREVLNSISCLIICITLCILGIPALIGISYASLSAS